MRRFNFYSTKKKFCIVDKLTAVWSAFSNTTFIFKPCFQSLFRVQLRIEETQKISWLLDDSFVEKWNFELKVDLTYWRHGSTPNPFPAILSIHAVWKSCAFSGRPMKKVKYWCVPTAALKLNTVFVHWSIWLLWMNHFIECIISTNMHYGAFYWILCTWLW